MSNCSNCNKKINFFNGQKIFGGYICNDCLKLIPSKLKENKGNLLANELNSIIQYTKLNQTKLHKFHSTYFFGDLHIDEQSGLFIFCKEKDIDNSTGQIKTNILDIYNSKEISNPRIYFIPDKQQKQNSQIKGIIKFACNIKPINISIDTVIKKNVYLNYERQDDINVKLVEPDDLRFFKDMFNQMLKNNYNQYLKEFENLKLKQELELERIKIKKIQNDLLKEQQKHILKSTKLDEALNLFMLDKDFNLIELKTQRNRLIKIFHPDNSGIDEKYSKKINDAYHFLLDYLDSK